MEGSGVARGTQTLLSKIRGGSLPIGAHTTGSEVLTNQEQPVRAQRERFAIVHGGSAAVAAASQPEAPSAA